MENYKPAISLAAVPGKRQAIVDLAKEVEDRGYPGVYCPSIGDGLALCTAIAMATERIDIATAITPIYFRQAQDYAPTVSFLHEISAGRFRFGIGVSHSPALTPRGLDGGKPLADTRTFVEQLKAVERVGELPPIILATLRKKMIKLSAEIGDGMIFANAARSHMSNSLGALDGSIRDQDTFFVGNMIPTCVDNDIDRARAVNRKTLSRYVLLPNYRNYWKEAGYSEEMEAVETALADKDIERIPECLSDRWLADTTLFGPAKDVRDGIEAWFDAGIKTPIIVPSAVQGGQFQAFEEFFSIWN